MRSSNDQSDAQEVHRLRRELDEARRSLRAIRRGEVDTLHGVDRRYRTIVETMQEGAATVSPDGTVLYANACLADFLQSPLEHVIGSSFVDWVSEPLQETARKLLARSRKVTVRRELTLRSADGETVPVMVAITPLPGTPSPGVCVVVTDLRQVKRSEEVLRSNEDELGRTNWALERTIDSLRSEIELRVQASRALTSANRALRVMGGCSRLLVRTQDEATFLREFCRLCVERGDYRLAWVGFCEDDPDKTIRPVAQAGYEEGYLDGINVSWSAETPRGQGPGGRAVRAEKPVVVQDVRADESFEPWRADAERRGYGAVIALPLKWEGHAGGVLSIYADQTWAFDPSELELLKDLATDLSFGIQTHRLRQARLDAEAELRESNQLLEQMFANIHVLVAYMDAEFNFIRVNRAYAEAGDRDPEWFVGRNHFEVYPHEENEVLFRRVVETGEPVTAYEKAFTYPDAPDRKTTYWDWTLRPLATADGGVRGMLLTLLDVTERKRAQQAVEEERRRLFEVLKILPAFVLLHSPETREIRFFNETFRRYFGEPDGRPCYEILRGRDEPCEICEAGRVLETGEVLEWDCATPQGRRFHIKGHKFVDADGTPMVLELGLDVTDRRRLEREVLEVADTEQRRIGQDLHDALGQTLTGLSFLARTLAGNLEAEGSAHARTAFEIADSLTETTSEARNLARGLCPAGMDADGLMHALRNLAETTRETWGKRCEWVCPDEVLVDSGNAATHLYRIAQEAVNNAVRHAECDVISIRLDSRDRSVILAVEDDGKGLPDGMNPDKGMGLRTMKYRAARIGATLHIRSTLGNGTVVRCELPEHGTDKGDSNG